MNGGELALLGRTAAHLQPAQVAHRARLRTQRVVLRRWPRLGQRLLAGPSPTAATARAGWPTGFTPLDGLMPQLCPALDELGSGRIRLLGMARDLGDPACWQHAGAPQLWRFHLHYWDWAWGLAADADRRAARAVFARLWRSWQASCAFGRGDAWLPYPAALRAWSWCGLHRPLVAGSDLEPGFLRALAAHAGFLRRHLESDVGGNQVLADLIDVAGLISAAGRAPGPELTQAISRMRRWLAAVLTPDGAVPLLNDGYPVAGALVAALRPGPAPDAPLLSLPDTGLVRAAAGGWHLVADAGAPCPDELPAHAHADTLGCLLHVDGSPLLVDTATSTYAAGPVRSYERSTAAHNTAEVDGADSTEVWGAFRAGRRARVHGRVARADGRGLTAEAAHDGYRRLPGRPAHRRRWLLTGAGLQVDDLVTGGRRHAVAVRWHLAPGADVRLKAGGAVVSTAAGRFPVQIGASGPLRISIEPAMVATGFLRTTLAPVLTCRTESALPIRITTCWRRMPGDSWRSA